MVAFINRLTGSTMYVADNRVDEYLAAGHTVANATPVEVSETEAPAEKKPRKKSTKEQ